MAAKPRETFLKTAGNLRILESPRKTNPGEYISFHSASQADTARHVVLKDSHQPREALQNARLPATHRRTSCTGPTCSVASSAPLFLDRSSSALLLASIAPMSIAMPRSLVSNTRSVSSRSSASVIFGGAEGQRCGLRYDSGHRCCAYINAFGRNLKLHSAGMGPSFTPDIFQSTPPPCPPLLMYFRRQRYSQPTTFHAYCSTRKSAQDNQQWCA